MEALKVQRGMGYIKKNFLRVENLICQSSGLLRKTSEKGKCYMYRILGTQGSTQYSNSSTSMLPVLKYNANASLSSTLLAGELGWVRQDLSLANQCLTILTDTLNSMFKDYFQRKFINYIYFPKTKDHKLFSKDFWSTKWSLGNQSWKVHFEI